VLVVDDDAGVRAVLTATLEAGGYTVREAPDGFCALQSLIEVPTDCILLDLHMPRLDGFGVLEAIRDEGLAPGVRVMVVSGSGDPDRFLRSWRLGADHYFPEPFEPRLLVRKVDELVQTPIEVLRRRREELLERADLLDRLGATLGVA